jgi:hypothetical protein
MSVEELVYAALCGVLSNTHAVELPERPTWPALVFEIDTNPEKGWVAGGGYDQHELVVSTLARSKAEIIALRQQVQAAISALPGFMEDEFSGDADFQGEAGVYAYVQNFRLRTRRQ